MSGDNDNVKPLSEEEEKVKKETAAPEVKKEAAVEKKETGGSGSRGSREGSGSRGSREGSGSRGSRDGSGGRGARRPRGRGRHTEEEEWVPKTQLGKLVKAGTITTMKDAIATGLPLREPRIVDTIMGDSLEDEVLKVNMVQRMTDSGRRTRFSITVVVGNGNGYVGLGAAKGKEVGPAIKKAIDNAKLNMIELVRGCGSWECGCMNPHSLPYKVEGKSGSALVTLRPAPRGVGLAVGDIAKKILKLAGINDAWGFSRGQTKTTVNNAKAVMDALNKITLMKVQESQRIELKHISGPVAVVQTEEDIGGEQE